MKRVILATAGLVLVLALPAGAATRNTASMKGVVVGDQHGALLVASSGGLVQKVSGRERAGTRVLIGGGRVLRTLGWTDRALVRGVVVRRTGGLMFLSATGHLLVVHLGVRRLASTSDTPPSPGTVVQGDQQLGQAGQVQVQATVTAVGTGTVTLNVNGQALTIPLPAGLSLPASLVGTQVTLNLSFANGQATANEQGDNGDQGDQGDSGD
ncbi:MAG: hypothetical protein E6F98_16850 [Actinobacteria bacterium]|nr:MAG: hypothetical protein E6F98_16850 [Actinomycetota bacterium]